MKNNRGFSLIELMVVITIMATLISISLPVYNKVTQRARIMKDVAHVDQIVKACKLYAQDWDGMFPRFDTQAAVEGGGTGENFSNSTDAFNELIREVDLGSEEIFYVQGNPDKRPPDQNGELVAEENSYTYVVGLSDSSPARSPLIADEQEGTGTYGKYHPWLKAKKAVVGYCGGQVVVEKLTQPTEGATIRGPAGSGIDNIFQEAQVDEEGKVSGGWLAVPTDNVVHPE